MPITRLTYYEKEKWYRQPLSLIRVFIFAACLTEIIWLKFTTVYGIRLTWEIFLHSFGIYLCTYVGSFAKSNKPQRRAWEVLRYIMSWIIMIPILVLSSIALLFNVVDGYRGPVMVEVKVIDTYDQHRGTSMVITDIGTFALRTYGEEVEPRKRYRAALFELSDVLVVIESLPAPSAYLNSSLVEAGK